MEKGQIYKALSGFYYIKTPDGVVSCRARGKFRKEGISPLVGDNVLYTLTDTQNGIIDEIMPRRNSFIRPPVANIDQLVIVASTAIPTTDPFLIDRICSIASFNNCETVLCLNKSDIDPNDELFSLYSGTDIKTIITSAETGLGIDELRQAIKGKVNAFTGNSGVGKTSILNRLEPGLSEKVGEVSEKLGRGKHTTRHVELFELSCGGYIADTPGFAAFDTTQMELRDADKLQYTFGDFSEYISDCRFSDCTHTKEAGCAVIRAVHQGKISKQRYQNYLRLYEQAKQIKPWETKKN